MPKINKISIEMSENSATKNIHYFANWALTVLPARWRTFPRKLQGAGGWGRGTTHLATQLLATKKKKKKKSRATAGHYALLTANALKFNLQLQNQ